MIFKEENLNKKNVIGLTKELKGLYLYKKLKYDKKGLLFVTNSLYEANHYYQIISNYTSEVLLFPMDDFLTSEAIATSPELKTTRIETLLSLIENDSKIVITNLMGYLRFLPPKKQVVKNIIFLKVGETYSIRELTEKLFKIGYEKTTIVNKTGDFAARGFILDVFPVNNENPVRIEFFDDQIEKIKHFDSNNQISYENLEEIEIPINTELIVDVVDNFNIKHRDIVKYSNPVNISEYIKGGNVFFDNYNNLEKSYYMLEEEMFNYSISINIDPKTIYMNNLQDLNPLNKYNFTDFENVSKNPDAIYYSSKEIIPFSKKKEEINERLNLYLKQGKKVIICLNNKYKINKLIDYLNNDKVLITNLQEINSKYINIINKPITYGFEIDDLIIIGEGELYNKKNLYNQYNSRFRLGTKIKDIRKLMIGDYVVHQVHGIGKYLGIKAIKKGELKKDYLQIEYKDNDKLYVPVEKIELISKYSSNEGAKPKLTKLGGVEWEKTKLRVKKRIENIAEDLLKLYAERESSPGFAFLKDDENQLEFESRFPYIPTNDQLKVSEEIKQNMEKAVPMDRLLCGDVGFGKTEVAFRAIFKAILSGKQVAFLCPTTILSKQHYNNALERFKDYPINIEILNRFVSHSKANDIMLQLQEGKIDILIGTHKILNDKIKFRDLGLLIIDEEQRFGVKHKEKIKQYKNNIDVLTLTATPIPRTLQLSMAGIRDLSLIETPPVNRYPIQTYVLEENNQIMKDAIYKEISRNGQVFILHNKIDSITSKVKEIQDLVPEAKITYAHGRMNKEKIENAMLEFTNGEYNVLVCTTIIETGIDIPNVNTLIVIDADRFGLSQLYQIRGRVGRGNKIAYCYLMYQKSKILSEIAIKRLKVIKDFTELGSGFAIAMRDLAIRGAGDILGSEQAGFIDSVGIELFLNMLNHEIELKKGNKIEEEIKELPLIDVNTSIDDNYVKEEELKIEIHNKINTIKTKQDLELIKEELENRFGKLSEDLIIYMHEELFEIEAKKLGIKNINQTKNFIEIILDKNFTNKIDGKKMFLKLNKISRMFRFSLKHGKLVITLDIIKLEKHFIYYLLEMLNIIEESLIS